MKEQLIAAFERDFWEISESHKGLLLALSVECLVLKLAEWQSWSACGGGLVFGRHDSGVTVTSWDDVLLDVDWEGLDACL